MLSIENYKEKDINIIIKKSLEKDSDSIYILLIRLRPVIISSIKKYCYHIDDFDDLIQDGYLHVIESLDRYDCSRGVFFLGYIQYSLKYFYLDKSKKYESNASLNKRVICDTDNSAEFIDFLEDNDICIEKDYEYAESISSLYKAIETLSKRERQVIVMYYLRGYGLITISKVLNIAYRTVVNTKVNGLRKLRENLLKTSKREGTFCP